MNDDKRIFALVSLGLLLAALLVPFIIAALGRDDLALSFAAVAGLLALLFGALGWGDRIGNTVTTVLLFILIVGIVGSAFIRTIRSQKAGKRPRGSLSAQVRPDDETAMKVTPPESRSQMNALIPVSRPGLAVWWSAFFSPAVYFLLLPLADTFHVPSPPESLVASLFYLIPAVALLVCGSVVWSSGMTAARKMRWMLFTLFAMVLQVGILVAITTMAAG